MGVGSGIVADSLPEAEYQEIRLKARFLTEKILRFRLLETMLWDEDAEGSISNIIIRKSRNYYTPPQSCGLLNVKVRETHARE